MQNITFFCPNGDNQPLIREEDHLVSPITGKKYSAKPFLNLLGEHTTQVSEHYTTQWSSQLGFAELMKKNTAAAKVTPGKQLGWPDLFARIRQQAMQNTTYVFDAACGFGGIFMELFNDPIPSHLTYVGADFHSSLGDIVVPTQAVQQTTFVRWDISKKLPVQEKFDYVICRAALHHTADPAVTLKNLAAVLKDEGTLAISVYTKKAPMREALDDYFRKQIASMPNDQAWETVQQFTQLGRDLQAVKGKINITTDLPFLNIKAGEYGLQEFIYDHFMKCWYNEQFGESSNIVNFDWYHPNYAYRYTLEQITSLVQAAGLTVKKTASIKAQHYLECAKQVI